MNDPMLTPRTSANKFTIGWVHDTRKQVVDLEFAEQLERELNEANRRYEVRCLCAENDTKEAVQELLPYVRHAPTCPMPARECDCGLKELLEAHND